MLEEIFGVFFKMWKKREWRPHIVNFVITITIAVIAFFYINFKHSEAMAAIRSQESLGVQILHQLDSISDRVDDVYRFLATRGR